MTDTEAKTCILKLEYPLIRREVINKTDICFYRRSRYLTNENDIIFRLVRIKRRGWLLYCPNFYFYCGKMFTANSDRRTPCFSQALAEIEDGIKKINDFEIECKQKAVRVKLKKMEKDFET